MISHKAISSDHTRKFFSCFLVTSRSRRLRWPQDIGTTWSACSRGNVQVSYSWSWHGTPKILRIWSMRVELQKKCFGWWDGYCMILLALSPVDVAKQNGTAWSTWRAFKSYQINSNNMQLNLPNWLALLSPWLFSANLPVKEVHRSGWQQRW